MANSTLITGAGVAASTFNDAQAGFNAGMAKSGPTEIAMMNMRNAMYKARQDEVELKNYVNSMETIDVSKVEESMRPEVNQFLIKNRNEYAAAAKKASELDAGDPAYLEAVNKMNSIDSAFKNLSSKMDGFKNRRDQYYKDDRDNSISEASNRGALDAMFKNNEYDIVINPTGGFSIKADDRYVDYSEFDEDGDYNYFLVNNEGFNNIMNLTNKAQQGGVKIEGGLKQNYRYQLNQMFNTMGREDMESMIYDTVISDTPLNKVPDNGWNDDLLLIENDGALRKWLSENYLKNLIKVGQGSYNQKRAIADQKIRDAANKSRSIAQAKKNVENDGKMSVDLNNITAEQKQKILDALSKQQAAAGEADDPLNPNE
tara:strand:- start:479 stop:1594 length:1116 start_codon:yes stop_codon:yes gene_type:complete